MWALACLIAIYVHTHIYFWIILKLGCIYNIPLLNSWVCVFFPSFSPSSFPSPFSSPSLFLLVWIRILHCPGRPWTSDVGEAGLELLFLSLPLEYWNYRHEQQCSAFFLCLSFSLSPHTHAHAHAQAHAYAETRGESWVFFLGHFLPFFFWDRLSHWDPGLRSSAGLGGPRVLVSLLYPHPSTAGAWHRLRVFSVGPGDRTQVLMPAWSALCPLNHCPSPSAPVFWEQGCLFFPPPPRPPHLSLFLSRLLLQILALA